MKKKEIQELLALFLKSGNLEFLDKFYVFLRKYHLDAPEVKYILSGNSVDFLRFSPEFEEFALAAYKIHDDDEVRAASLHALASGYSTVADMCSTLDGLNMSVEEFIELEYPANSDTQDWYSRAFSRWSISKWEEFREKAIDYGDRFCSKQYRNISQPIIFSPAEGEIDFGTGRKWGRIARGLRSRLENIPVGARIGDVRVSDTDGSEVHFSTATGSVRLLYIWSTKCDPCKTKLPKFARLVSDIANRGDAVEMITLCVSENEDSFLQYIQEHKLHSTNCWIGQKTRIIFDWQIYSYPTTVIVDGQGVVRGRGSFGEAFVRRAIETLSVSASV